MRRGYLIAFASFGLIAAAFLLRSQILDIVAPPRELAGLNMVDIQPGNYDLTILVPNSLGRKYYTKSVDIPDPFQIGQSEITIDQWNICFEDGGCPHEAKQRRYQSGNHPVTKISWYDAFLFTRWLSKETRETYRLPTEEEWGYIATSGRNFTKKTIDDLITKRQIRLTIPTSGSARTRKVGAFGFNDWKILDVTGSVWEWTLTCRFSSDDESRKVWTIEQLSDPNFCPNRIVQGDERAHVPYFVNEVLSGGCGTGAPVDNIGFRVVKELGS